MVGRTAGRTAGRAAPTGQTQMAQMRRREERMAPPRTLAQMCERSNKRLRAAGAEVQEVAA